MVRTAWSRAAVRRATTPGSPRRRPAGSAWTATSRSAGPTPTGREGNLLLDALLDAQLHFSGAAGYYEIEDAITALAEQLRSEGRRPYAIPVGGASVPGVAAYALAVDELRGQLDRDPDWIVVADGSGGTHAGLLAGLGADSPTRVIGVDVGTRPDLDGTVPRMAADAAEHLGRGAPNGTVIVDHDHVGAGYGEPVGRMPPRVAPGRAVRGPRARPGVLGEGDGRAVHRRAVGTDR